MLWHEQIHSLTHTHTRTRERVYLCIHTHIHSYIYILWIRTQHKTGRQYLSLRSAWTTACVREQVAPRCIIIHTSRPNGWFHWMNDSIDRQEKCGAAAAAAAGPTTLRQTNWNCRTGNRIRIAAGAIEKLLIVLHDGLLITENYAIFKSNTSTSRPLLHDWMFHVIKRVHHSTTHCTGCHEYSVHVT